MAGDSAENGAPYEISREARSSRLFEGVGIPKDCGLG